MSNINFNCIKLRGGGGRDKYKVIFNMYLMEGTQIVSPINITIITMTTEDTRVGDLSQVGTRMVCDTTYGYIMGPRIFFFFVL